MPDLKQLTVVNRMISAVELDEEAFGVVIGVARGLARRVDTAGGLEKCSMDLAKLYLSASKDLQRAVAAKSAPNPSKSGPSDVEEGLKPDPTQPPQLHAVEEGPLAKLRRQEAARAAQPGRRKGAAG